MLLVPVGVLALTGCLPTPTPTPTPVSDPAQAADPCERPAGVCIDLEMQDWNGWSSEPPSSTVQVLELTVGDTFTVDAIVGPVEFEVASIEDDGVALTLDPGFVVEGEANEVDMDAPDVTALELAPGEPVDLATTTFDMGTSVTLVVVD